MLASILDRYFCKVIRAYREVVGKNLA